MRSDPSVGTAKPDKPTWQQMVAKYQNPSLQRSLWQVANTLIPYFVLLTLMYVSLSYSYWITLALALPAGGLLTRSFIIFHDCGHGSFFKSQRANNFLGTICGLLVFTPYYQWRFEHAIHHATSYNDGVPRWWCGCKPPSGIDRVPEISPHHCGQLESAPDRVALTT